MELPVVAQPQFVGHGPHVHVRNTFLDFDDRSGNTVPQPRSRTVPPGGERGRWEDTDAGDDTGTARHVITTDLLCGGELIPSPWSADEYSYIQNVSGTLPNGMPRHLYGVQVPLMMATPMVTAANYRFGISTAFTNDNAQIHRNPPPQLAAPSGTFELAPSGAAGACAVTGIPLAKLLSRPQTLACDYIADPGYFQVHWIVDARKLRGNDKQAVSPPFDLHLGSHVRVTFKMMIYAKSTTDCKGGACFKKAKGKGIIQLKCEGDIAEVAAETSFHISIGNLAKMQPPRGPIVHNFAKNAVRGLPEDQEEWDFANAIDDESLTFVVRLVLVPSCAVMPRVCK